MLLDIRNLKTYYSTQQGNIKAVDDISFDIRRGEAVGLAGESGCGKTTVGYSIMRLVPKPGKIVGGHVLFDGKDLISLDEEELRRIRWKNISMVFQGAMNAFDPVISIEKQICEAFRQHNKVTRQEAVKKTKDLFWQVGLDTDRISSFPFEFSGGMKQRALIAMALCCSPDLVICDEPTTALDVTVQVQVLSLLNDLRKSMGMAIILITHDLSVIAETCDRVIIMYAGKIIESADSKSLFIEPIHPYTKGLIEAIPSMEMGKSKRLFSIPGEPPTLLNPHSGCLFRPRCPYAKEDCRLEPEVREFNGRKVKCHFAEEMKGISAKELWSR
jgi:peptide/nickel transport system ATP-binding protein